MEIPCVSSKDWGLGFYVQNFGSRRSVKEVVLPTYGSH